MKVSVNWLKEYTKTNLPIDKLVEKIWAQLGAVEETHDLGAKYEGAIIAKVVSCQNHPDADKLHLCLIDDGGVAKEVPRDENGYVQVVCGANNVAEGQSVVWLPPGVIVPETYGTNDQFELTAKELRGILSQGMIASARELDFGDDHDGIIVLDHEVKPGTPITEVFWLNDYVIDIENKMFTHRPDCFGVLGIAREIAGIQGIQFTSPDWYINNVSGSVPKSTEVLTLKIINEAPELSPRFMALAMSGIEITKSPLWLQTFLARLGVKPINNVVDATNFMMLLTGQPLHAYDYDKVAKANKDGQARLIVRKPVDGEELILLGNKKIKLDAKVNSAVIATNNMAIGLGGIMGGVDTIVDENTTSIILECANFDMFAIRKTAMKYGIFTDAFTRFSKNQSKLQNDKVIAKTALIMNELAKAAVASDIFDTPTVKGLENSVSITADFINARLGLKLSLEEVSKLLTNVEFKTRQDQDKLVITAPFWRTDIEIAEDIVEEIGRLYGYDKLPVKLPNRTLKPAQKDDLMGLKSQIRHILSAAGANELLTYSFVHGNLIDKVGQNKDLAYQLSNALSPDLQYYRMSLLPSLLEKVHYNIKAGHSQFGLFEIGKTHLKNWLDEEKLPKEEERLAFIFAADNKQAHSYSGAPYFQTKKYLSELLSKMGIEYGVLLAKEEAKLAINEQLASCLDTGRSAIIVNKSDGVLIGVMGEIKAEVRQKLKLPDFCAGFELDITALMKYKNSTSNYHPLSKFPKVEQDITLKCPSSVSFSELHELLKKQLKEVCQKDFIYELSPLGIYSPEKAEYKNFSFRLSIASYERTLKAQEINELLDKIAQKANQQLKSTRI